MGGALPQTVDANPGLTVRDEFPALGVAHVVDVSEFCDFEDVPGAKKMSLLRSKCDDEPTCCSVVFFFFMFFRVPIFLDFL